jgi:hypothetical protein
MRELPSIAQKSKPSKMVILFVPQLMLRAKTARFLQLVKLIIATYALSKDAKKVLHI